jgi:hypothetical protein
VHDYSFRSSGGDSGSIPFAVPPFRGTRATRDQDAAGRCHRRSRAFYPKNVGGERRSRVRLPERTAAYGLSPERLTPDTSSELVTTDAGGLRSASAGSSIDSKRAQGFNPSLAELDRDDA